MSFSFFLVTSQLVLIVNMFSGRPLLSWLSSNKFDQNLQSNAEEVELEGTMLTQHDDDALHGDCPSPWNASCSQVVLLNYGLYITLMRTGPSSSNCKPSEVSLVLLHLST